MKVGIVLGSRSQWSTMKHSAELLAQFGIPYEARIITANKNANQLHDYANKAINRGLDIIIAGTTKKAHLPEIIASKTEVPVLGIQINNSTKQNNKDNSNSDNNTDNPTGMHNTGAEGAINAALFAANMFANKHPRIRENLMKYHSQNEYEGKLQ